MREYLYGIGGSPISITTNGANSQTYYYLYNAHGDTIGLADSTGVVVENYAYGPWGEQTSPAPSALKNPFLYAGQYGIYHDLETGFDLMLTRYYNSSIQRFISPDAFPGTVAKPISHNAYAYVHNDPVNNVDPDGHWPQWMQNIASGAKSVVNTVATGLSNAYNSAVDAFNAGVNYVVDKVEAAGQYIKEKAQNFAAWGSSKYQSTKAALKHTGKKAIKKAKEIKSAALDKVKKEYEEAKAALAKAEEERKQAAQERAEALKQSASTHTTSSESGQSSVITQERSIGTKILDGVQFALDIGGLAPGIGEPIDGANALIYLARGDKVNAALSASSMIPIVGWGGTIAKFAKKADDVIDAAEGAGNGGSVGAAKRLIYEASPKHGPTAKGSISAAPRNGQEALDLSLQVKSTSPRRVGIDYATGEFNVFDQTSVGVFHGHVRSWNELTSEMQRVLRQAGMVDSRGRILGGQ